MDSLFAFIEKLIEEFSWKRFLFVISLICTLLVAIIIFESYTGNFRLARIEKSIDIITKLNALPDLSNENKDILSNAIKGVSNDINTFTNGNSTPFSLQKDVLKVIAALAPWFVILIFMLSSSGTSGIKSAMLGMSIFAIPGAILGYYLPLFEKQWINYLAYPFVYMFLAIFFVVAWQKRN